MSVQFILKEINLFQIQKVVIALGDFMHAQCHACIGGTNVREDMRKLEMGVHVVVGTPGRVYDMISRRALRTNCIKLFVLDEADEMLSRGFKDQIQDVFKLLPNEVQVTKILLFSQIFLYDTINICPNGEVYIRQFYHDIHYMKQYIIEYTEKKQFREYISFLFCRTIKL